MRTKNHFFGLLIMTFNLTRKCFKFGIRRERLFLGIRLVEEPKYLIAVVFHRSQVSANDLFSL